MRKEKRRIAQRDDLIRELEARDDVHGLELLEEQLGGVGDLEGDDVLALAARGAMAIVTDQAAGLGRIREGGERTIKKRERTSQT